jgi:hypothetical protein
MFSIKSYTARPAKIQRASIPVAAVCLVLTACSQISVPLGSDDVDTPLVLTGSIPSATDVSFADIDQTDRRIIAGILETVIEGKDDDATLSWVNNESGNSGTIASLDASGMQSTGCIGFRTTANTIEGVRLYKGTACRDISGELAITELNTSDA